MRILIRNKKLAEGSVNVCTKCDEIFVATALWDS